MIKIVLKRRKDSGTYLATASRHPPPPLLPIPPLAAPANTEVSLPLQLMKVVVPAESYI